MIPGRLLPALLILLGGCAGISTERATLPDDIKSVEIEEVPFYPQDRFQCGPAALTTVLTYSGIAADIDDVVDKVYLPGREGTIQAELLGATRSAGRIPLLIDGSLNALHAELHAGRPVLVLQNLGVSWIPSWHYAVIVGLDTENETVILRSGVDSRRVTPMRLFMRTWQRSDFWGFVALRPGELPEGADRITYLKALTAFENVNPGDPDNLLAWDVAYRRWNSDPTILFGYANALDELHQSSLAEAIYRETIALGGHTVAARNNLALLLARTGRHEEALAEIDKAFESNTDPGIRPILLDSRRSILESLKD
jgi:tetratricopeptide (TPR) repeat protein